MSEPRDMSDREGLAAEYVLGTLPLPERLAAERLIASDAAFAAMVEAWQRHLEPLNDAYPDLDPPAGLLPRIEARLFPAAPRRARWRLPFFGALAAAIAALVFFLPEVRPDPTLRATLTGEGQPLTVTAAYYEDSQELVFTRSAGPDAGADKDYELWVIPAGQAPVSLGVLRAAEVRVAMAALPPGTTLAVTLEQTGGSPTGAPQGPLLVATVIGRG